MNIPRIKNAFASDHKTLIVTFDTGETKRYDMSKLLSDEVFSPLRNQAFFKNIKVESGGYAVYWNDKIDISEFELWKNGTTL